MGANVELDEKIRSSAPNASRRRNQMVMGLIWIALAARHQDGPSEHLQQHQEVLQTCIDRLQRQVDQSATRWRDRGHR